MSRFLLLNFEEFGLNQDITKTIQPFIPFCICCLDRENSLINLEKCKHSDYLETFDIPAVKQFRQLVCIQCHAILKIIKCFQQQILESFEIMLSESFSNTTANNKKTNNLTIQDAVDIVLPPAFETDSVDFVYEDLNKETIPQTLNEDLILQDFNKDSIGGTLNEDSILQDLNEDSIPQEFNEDSIAHNFNENLISHNLNKDSILQDLNEDSIPQEMNEDSIAHNINGNSISHNLNEDSILQDLNEDSIAQNLNENSISHVLNENSISQGLNEDSISQHFNEDSITQHFDEDLITNKLNKEYNIDVNTSNEEYNIPNSNITNVENKNIRTALDILERNNQNFITLGNQLQFLNGEHLSFLEPSLLSKEILTDLPLIPKCTDCTDLENDLANSSKTLEIEIGQDKNFYDSLDRSLGLIVERNPSDTIKSEIGGLMKEHDVVVPKKKVCVNKSRKDKERKLLRDHLSAHIRLIKLSQEELNRERVQQAQSYVYLRFKFRCETCLIGFNFAENLDDHMRRKHGPTSEGNVTCGICAQVLPSVGSVTEHNYKHYTRYKCMKCDMLCFTHDEALRHVTRCVNNGAGSTGIAKKKKTKAQLQKARLKRMQAKILL